MSQTSQIPEACQKSEAHQGDAVFTTHVGLPDGSRHLLQAPAGWRLMEVLRDYGLPVIAECGGACSCATCHVRIQAEGQTPLIPPTDVELGRLDQLFDADDCSRLSCQILTGPQTDGLVLCLNADSVRPKDMASQIDGRGGQRESLVGV